MTTVFLIGAYVFGMFSLVLILALFPKKSEELKWLKENNRLRMDRIVALRRALTKSNIACAVYRDDADAAIKLADSAVNAYKIVAEELDHVYMVNEHLEERLLVKDRLIVSEVLSEFE